MIFQQRLCLVLLIFLQLAICQDVFVWGYNSNGQLGLGDSRQRNTRTALGITDNTLFVSVSAGTYHTLAVTDSGKCLAWGLNRRGQLGLGYVDNGPSVPTEIESPVRFVSVTTRGQCSFALSDKGEVYSWGGNDWGELGIPIANITEVEDMQKPKPQLIKTLVGINIMSISAGVVHCLAVNDDGELYTWGANFDGQLGLGDFTERRTPTLVRALKGLIVKQAVAGGQHNVVVTDKGHVFTWGSNERGQLGFGDQEGRRLPFEVVYLRNKNITSVGAGWYHSFAVSDRGVLYAWGSNEFGQLGTGDKALKLTPTMIKSLIDAKQEIYTVWGGQQHTVAITVEGRLYAWGSNQYGTLGLGDETDRNVPVPVTTFDGKNLYLLAAGSYHSMGVAGCHRQIRACAGNGRCRFDHSCQCNLGFSGHFCNIQCEGGFNNPCSGNGQCQSDGSCECNPGYMAADCSIVCMRSELGICSNRGRCLKDGSCLCQGGYQGSACEFECPGNVASPCSDLGVCNDKGSCDCLWGFSGNNCSIECDGGAYAPCSNHGMCQADGSCICFPGFVNPDCSRACDGEANNPCYGHGTCMPDGSCECRTGYRGKACEIECPGGVQGHLDGYEVLLRVCSGFGDCSVDGKCTCVEGYQGEGCSEEPSKLLMFLIIGAVALSLVVLCLVVYIMLRRSRSKLRKRKEEREQMRKAQRRPQAVKRKAGNLGRMDDPLGRQIKMGAAL